MSNDLFQAHRSSYGLAVSWLAKGWVSMAVDDFGDAYEIFKASPKDWPHGAIATHPVIHDVH